MSAPTRNPTEKEKAPESRIKIPANLPILPPKVIEWDYERKRRQPKLPAELPLEIPEVPDEPDRPQREVNVDYSIRFYER